MSSEKDKFLHLSFPSASSYTRPVREVFSTSAYGQECMVAVIAAVRAWLFNISIAARVVHYEAEENN